MSEFDLLCEVQSDKATVEVTARCGGVVAARHGVPGDVIQVGGPLVDLALPAGAAPPPGLEVVLAGPAGSGGRGGGGGPADAAAAPTPASRTPPTPTTPTTSPTTLASPAVRRVARELGVDLAALGGGGSGPGGRILREDVEGAAAGVVAPPAPPTHTHTPTHTPTTTTTTTLPLRGFRRAMVASMTAAAAVPHFHYAEDVRVDALVALRAALGADPGVAAALAAAAGAAGLAATDPPLRLTYLPFILRALSAALGAHPLANAALAPGGRAVTLHADHNFGIAVDTPSGLAVPVLARAQDRSLAGLAAEVARLSSAAGAGRLTPSDVAGGTLTVSNIGAVGGGGHAAPLVHVPQACILAVGRCVCVCVCFGGGGGGGGRRDGEGHHLPFPGPAHALTHTHATPTRPPPPFHPAQHPPGPRARPDPGLPARARPPPPPVLGRRPSRPGRRVPGPLFGGRRGGPGRPGPPGGAGDGGARGVVRKEGEMGGREGGGCARVAVSDETRERESSSSKRRVRVLRGARYPRPSSSSAPPPTTRARTAGGRVCVCATRARAGAAQASREAGPPPHPPAPPPHHHLMKRARRGGKRARVLPPSPLPFYAVRGPPARSPVTPAFCPKHTRAHARHTSATQTGGTHGPRPPPPPLSSPPLIPSSSSIPGPHALGPGQLRL